MARRTVFLVRYFFDEQERELYAINAMSDGLSPLSTKTPTKTKKEAGSDVQDRDHDVKEEKEEEEEETWRNGRELCHQACFLI